MYVKKLNLEISLATTESLIVNSDATFEILLKELSHIRYVSFLVVMMANASDGNGGISILSKNIKKNWTRNGETGKQKQKKK